MSDTTTTITPEWLSLDDAARRCGFGCGRAVSEFARRTISRTGFRIRRTPGKIHLGDLLKALDAEAARMTIVSLRRTPNIEKNRAAGRARRARSTPDA